MPLSLEQCRAEAASGYKSIRAAAEFLGDICENEVRKLVKNGRLRTVLYGRRVLIPLVDLQEYAAQLMYANEIGETT